MRSLLLLLSMVICAGTAFADCDPLDLILGTTVLPCDNLGPVGYGGVVVCPGTPSSIAASLVTVTSRCNGQPLADMVVTVTFGSPQIVGCTSPDPLPWEGVTDANGVWTKNFNAGGCFTGANACVIALNGVPIRSYIYVKSPDWNGGQSNLAVQADDFASFLSSFNPGTPGCHNYDNDGDTDLADFVVFASGFNPGHQCP